jgi:hypothetical protein
MQAIDTPLKTKGKTTYEIATDRFEQERTQEELQNQQYSSKRNIPVWTATQNG